MYSRIEKKTSVDTHVRVFFFYFSELNNFQTSSKLLSNNIKIKKSVVSLL